MNEFKSKNTQGDPLSNALNRWANDADGYQPLDTAALAIASPPSRRRSAFGWRVAATLTAAAMFLFALTQVSFTVSMGDATLQWGVIDNDSIVALADELADAKSRIDVFENQLMAHAEAINTVSVQNAVLGESLHVTAVELAQRQQLESAARVYDMRNLAQFVSYQQ